ncbi:hypothetical protein Tco_0407954 [Tanacetum coccineum]
MTSARVPTGEERKEIEEGPQPIKPLNLAFDITSSSQAQFITPVHPNTQAVDEAFVMAKVDKEREMEAPLRYQTQPFVGAEGVRHGGYTAALAAHLREVKRRRRTLSPREALNACRSPVYEVHYSNHNYGVLGEVMLKDFNESKDHYLTLKNTPYPHQRYAVYNTLVNEEESTGLTLICRIHQEDTAYPYLHFTNNHEGLETQYAVSRRHQYAVFTI